MGFAAGSLVHVRGKDWVVLPSKDPDLLMIKPLHGVEEEATGIYLPLGLDSDIRSTVFPPPRAHEIGDLSSARLLYNALRLSFRTGAGPFRSLGRLSFRPRGYQLVPLIMALRQAEEPLRLMIADDVGVGKTIEALLIVRELLDRREIERFAVICPPHLCEQWRYELSSKFGIEAVIVRSSTQARLDRGVRGDASVFSFYPYQVVSIDYIKSERHRRQFVSECPELVIVDEAHSCARPSGASETQQQRFRLVREIADRPGQGLMLLTATPHSGKTDEFRSLLGLLDQSYEGWDILSAGEQERRELAERYVQRRRKDVELWQGLHSSERTPFPKRDALEIPYSLTPSYRRFYERLHAFARALITDATGHEGVRRMRYWSALTLLRGAMSSPASGLEMIRTRTEENAAEGGDDENPLYDREEQGIGDAAAGPILSKTRWSATQRAGLNSLAEELSGLASLENDAKAKMALEIVSSWVSEGLRPVVFCKFIATANHLGTLLKPALEREFPGIAVEVVTSEDPDEVRKARVEDMADSERRVLIATDCLSEGINLQDLFSAVLHYDLPWNPNRLEQREGRVDRYGQTALVVKACLLYGADNPIDGVVLRVLLRKVREIKSSIGISIPFPEDSLTLMDAVMQAVLLSDPAPEKTVQFELDLASESNAILKVSSAVQEASRREEATRSVFAQRSIHPEEIEEDLSSVDHALGDPSDVEGFSVEAVQRVIGAPTKRLKGERCHSITTANLPAALREDLQRIPALGLGKPARSRTEVRVGFESPVPDGFLYIGRMHPFVESLCRQVMTHGFEGGGKARLGRAAAVRTKNVSEKTVLLLFRARHIVEDTRKGVRLVAEEAVLCGYEGSAQERRFLSDEKARSLMANASASSDLSDEARRETVTREIADVAGLEAEWLRVAEARASALAESHERFRRALERRKTTSARYRAAAPAVPMDLVGLFVLLPEIAR